MFYVALKKKKKKTSSPLLVASERNQCNRTALLYLDIVEASSIFERSLFYGSSIKCCLIPKDNKTLYGSSSTCRLLRSGKKEMLFILPKSSRLCVSILSRNSVGFGPTVPWPRKSCPYFTGHSFASLRITPLRNLCTPAALDEEPHTNEKKRGSKTLCITLLLLTGGATALSVMNTYFHYENFQEKHRIQVVALLRDISYGFVEQSPASGSIGHTVTLSAPRAVTITRTHRFGSIRVRRRNVLSVKAPFLRLFNWFPYSVSIRAWDFQWRAQFAYDVIGADPFAVIDTWDPDVRSGKGRRIRGVLKATVRVYAENNGSEPEIVALDVSDVVKSDRFCIPFVNMNMGPIIPVNMNTSQDIVAVVEKHVSSKGQETVFDTCVFESSESSYALVHGMT